MKRLLGRWTSLILLCFTLACLVWTSSSAIFAENGSINSLKSKQRATQAKIERIRAIKRQLMLKEKSVASNIIKNQRHLEASEHSLKQQEGMLIETKTTLMDLESSLDIAIAEQQELASEVGKRLRSLYMKENLSFVYMFLDAGDLATLMDRLYFKKRLTDQDKKLYRAYVYKTQVLEEKKHQLVVEKERLNQTISRIERYQDILEDAVQVDKLLINKLRTSRQAYEAAEDQLQRESYSIERQIMAMTRRGGTVLGSTGRLAAPVSAGMTSSFGYRFHPIFRIRRFHSGIDFGARTGTAIRAADGGRVIHAGWQGGYGKVVIINHGSQQGGNISTLYGHMSSIGVSTGQNVTKGQYIGAVGSTGYSTGPHLHFEVRLNGRPVNPLGYLR